MSNYHFSIRSSNAKTGPIPVSSTSRDSCPNTCPLKDDGGCYGENYGLSFHWNALDNGKRGGDLSYLCKSVSSLPAGTFWRANQVGDLAHHDGSIDPVALGELVAANIGKRGFTYTHHLPELADNAHWIKSANELGFAINLSANDADQADEYCDMQIGPVVCLIPPTDQKTVKTNAGRTVVVCPSQVRDDVTCDTCRMCAIIDRDFIIGFIGHGSRAGKVIKLSLVRS